MEDSRNLRHTLTAVLIIKALERIGDHAKNIAEYCAYPAKGKDVRHVNVDHLSDEVSQSDSGEEGEPTGE